MNERYDVMHRQISVIPDMIPDAEIAFVQPTVLESEPMLSCQFVASAEAQSSRMGMADSVDVQVISRLSTKVASAHWHPFCEMHIVRQPPIHSDATSSEGMRPAAAADREPV